jgi:hypothetical protein
MSVNGSGPRRRAGPHISRRMRLLIGTASAFVIAGVLVAPIVLLTGGSASTCARALFFRGGTYVARPVPSNAVVQAIAIGVGVASGCGASPANVNVRSLAGIAPVRAVALAADNSSIYVRRGICSGALEAGLAACLRRS